MTTDRRTTVGRSILIAYGDVVPDGFQTCNVYRDGVQTNHLVRWVNGGTPGRTVLCGLTRFDSKPGARDADLPGWSMGGGVFGPNVRQAACAGCWEAASTVPDHLPDNDESRGHGSVR